MSLKENLQADIIAAMKARETNKLATLRLLSAAIKQREVDSQTTLDDAAVIAVIEKACKQRRESIAQYQQANRLDLVEVEQYELDIISAYLPAQMSDTEINQAVADAIAQTGATSMQDMGKVMGVLKGALAGKADMSKVSTLIKTQLS
ncbi:MAG: GatB/YqeY domain-containing protein [Burkholderiales bacterium]|nr:GatB/YqeY domain-containing protein [Burkholderiales bacterium]MCE1176744.1 GatB/YqeY domain-containing protein [Burkholderiales bacterium]